MHEVRVYANPDKGTLWWAEDDLGFTGGAERMADLVASIQEWAEAEGVLDILKIRLVADETETSAADGSGGATWSFPEHLVADGTEGSAANPIRLLNSEEPLTRGSAVGTVVVSTELPVAI